MEKNTIKKIESKEKHFLNFLKRLHLLQGVIGEGGKWDKSSKPAKFIKSTQKFLIIDENFKVIFENEPFNKSGNYHTKVVDKLKELGINDEDDEDIDDINDEDDDNDISFEKGTRTDDSVEELISNIETSASLSWYCNFHSDELDENHFPKRLPEESYELEPSSKEFEEFDKVCDFMKNAVKKHSESKSDLREIEYEYYTEKGKNKIDECIEWFKNNKSKTPIQDAWFKVLEKNGIKVDWKPFDSWCDIPVMKNIDYSSKEELDAKREKEDEEFKKSITPEMRAKFKQIAESLKK